MFPSTLRLSLRLVVVCVVSGLLLGMVGCKQSGPSSTAKGKSSSVLKAQRRASKNNTLFRSIVAQLNHLPESSRLALTPPTVLLDARNSVDGKDVLATLSRVPGAIGGPFNVVQVPAGNAGFKALGVAPGDTLKYFIDYDDETRARIEESGSADIYTWKAKDLTVAQVIDNNILLIAGGLSGEVLSPTKIEIWRNVDDLMKEIDARLGRYAARRDPALSWQPTPDGKEIDQLTERLNQWLRQNRTAEPTATLSEDFTALIATLPESLRTSKKLSPLLAKKERTVGRFHDYETRSVQGSTWIRDISRWAQGEQSTEQARATALFDWTVRNIQLLEPSETSPRFVWEILLHGQGDAAQRALIFTALCQQQSLPAVVVEVPLTESDSPYLLVGVAIDGGLVLFDPTLGLPLPGQEADTVATLKELQQKDALLRALDLPDSPYPLTSEALASVELRVVADPFALTDRAKRLDQKLTGENRLALTLDYKTMVSILPEGESPVLWAFPFQVLADKFAVDRAVRNREVKSFLPYAWRPRLWKARTLHFRGIVSETVGDEGEVVNDYRDAQRLYMHPRVRPTDKQLLRGLDSDVKRDIYYSAKTSATYSLGLIAYEQGKFANAAQWLDNSSLASEWGKPLADGVRYNRARVYEALGEWEQAAKLLEADESPQQHGNQLRALRLRALGVNKRLREQAATSAEGLLGK